MTDVITNLPPSIASASPIPLPPRLFIPLPPAAQRSTDHKPLGARVVRGEALLAATAGASHVPVAPVDGTIAAVGEVRLLNGAIATALQLDVSTDSAPAPPQPSPASISPTENLTDFIERLRLAGIWAQRETSPDLLAQLHDVIRRPVDTLVVNLLEVDGGSTLNGKLVRERGPSLIAGALAVAKATGAARVWFAADPRLADRVSVHIRKARAANRAKVIDLPNDYPQANPTLLLYALLARRLKPGKLPTEVGAVLLDGAAAVAIGRLNEAGEAMLAVPIELRDSTRSRAHLASAAVGTPLSFVLDALKLDRRDYTLRGGAALRDIRVPRDAIVSAGGELSIDAGVPSPPINPDPCIRCGWCVESCPVRINPAGILEAAQDNDLALADRYGLDACVECGICSYVCPSRLPLLGAIRNLRSDHLKT